MGQHLWLLPLVPSQFPERRSFLLGGGEIQEGSLEVVVFKPPLERQLDLDGQSREGAFRQRGSSPRRRARNGQGGSEKQHETLREANRAWADGSNTEVGEDRRLGCRNSSFWPGGASRGWAAPWKGGGTDVGVGVGLEGHVLTDSVLSTPDGPGELF